jgi:hypothetical protein
LRKEARFAPARKRDRKARKKFGKEQRENLIANALAWEVEEAAIQCNI